MSDTVISKKALCVMYGFIMPCGRPNYKALRQHVMTDELLERIGLDIKRYKSMRLFPIPIGDKIIFELALTSKMLLKAGIHI